MSKSLSLIELIKQEMDYETHPSTFRITKQSEELLLYLMERFECKSTDEVINYLIGYAGTTIYTDRIASELKK